MSEIQTVTNLSAMLEDDAWEPFRGDLQKIKSFQPNRIYHNKTDRTAAIVIGRALGGDFALSRTAFNFVRDAVNAKKIDTAYVALKERDGTDVIASATLAEVERAVRDARPNDGLQGFYWWLDATFKIAEKQSPRATVNDWM